MRTLHVAAMPFPSQQGTQALLHTMLDALCEAGDDTHLLCYAEAAFARETRYTVHRTPAGPRASLRAGPSFAKLRLDRLLAQQLPTLVRQLRPDAVIAHHVEAAAVALATVDRPVLFVAHTSLHAELASYFPAPLAGLCRTSGELLDTLLCRAADRVLTVSPRLARLLTTQSGARAHALPIPWYVPPALDSDERARARQQLGVGSAEQVLVYAGNLDAYQGLAPMLAGVAKLARVKPLRLVLATLSPRTQVASLLQLHGLAERTLFAGVADEPARRLVHAAADLVLVPRACEGGVSIKLLDALARGAHVVAAERAAANFPMRDVCALIDGDDPHAWQAAIQQQLAALPNGTRGPDYIRQHHAPAAFAERLAGHVRAACEVRSHTRAGFFRRAIRR